VFTGIVEGTRRVVGSGGAASQRRLEIDLEDLAAGVRPGDSVAVNGCCLTVTKLEGPVASFDVVRETLELTNLDSVKQGDRVNVERSLKVGDALGGHFVTGHVEGVGRIVAKVPGSDQTTLTVEVPAGVAGLMVHKGSVTLDGVSLTITKVDGRLVSVALIPHTLERTTLGSKGTGERVNVEPDLIGKWVKQLLPGATS